MFEKSVTSPHVSQLEIVAGLSWKDLQCLECLWGQHDQGKDELNQFGKHHCHRRAVPDIKRVQTANEQHVAFSHVQHFCLFSMVLPCSTSLLPVSFRLLRHADGHVTRDFEEEISRLDMAVEFDSEVDQ